MSGESEERVTGGPAFGWTLAVPTLSFVGSGCAALIYEIVWFQLLQLVIGSSAVSVGVLLATFMGGMCLGSLGLARVVSARHHPLRVYALLELGIGLSGMVVLLVVPYLARVYTAGTGHGLPSLLLRGAVGMVCLLPPTVLMGATLPAVARWIDTTPRGVSWLGLFYGANTVGGVIGCLLAGFYLLRVHDLATATCVAAAINGAVALINVGLAAVTPRGALAGNPGSDSAAESKPGVWAIYLAIGLSGLSALGAEVVWTRLLSLVLGPTVYTFSIILAVFLAGLGVGSGIGASLARGKMSPRLALGVCQLMLAAGIAWAAWSIARSLPYWPIDVTLSRSPWLNFQLDLVRCLWAIFPATCLWGASFPLALAAVASPGRDAGQLVGRVYAANTAGAIVGAIGFSIVVIAWVGTQQAQRLLIGVATAAALFALIPPQWPGRLGLRLSGRPGRPAWSVAGAVSLLAALVVAAVLAWDVPKLPWGLVAYGRYLPTKEGEGKLLYLGEGMNASVAVTELSSGVRNFHISGKVEASTDAQDMRLQRMLAHLPALLHPRPRSVLIVGCGAGVTAGSFVVHPDIEKIVICEIEPLIPRVVAQYFGEQNYQVLKDPRVQVVYDDARHYLLTTHEKFDIITSDPIHPWVKGAATLYTKEYFELVGQHLNPGGWVTQWVPLYESSSEVVKSEIATFFDAFPGGTVWSNDQDGEGYDLVLLAQTRAMTINVDQLHLRFNRDARVAESLQDVGFKSMVGLLATYAGRGRDLQPWLQGAHINRDRNLRLQYLAGMWLNLNESGLIYDAMASYRRFPEDLLVGTEERKQMVRLVIDRSRSSK